VNLQHKAALLARTELFHGVDEETRTRVAERAVARVFERGQILFIQGAPSDRLFVLVRGAVKELATMVSGARQTVNQVLRSLESRGYIRAAGRVFEILDRERLEDLAEQ
jgi:CRP-like cAMP-binding protein